MSKLESFNEISKIFGKDIIITERKNGDMICKYKDHTGEGNMKIYQLFDGVQLIFNEFYMDSCYRKIDYNEDVITLNYCLKGRFECEFEDGTLVYIGEGDLAVNPLTNITTSSSFPKKEFIGVSIVIHKALVSKSMNEKFSEYSIDFKKILLKVHNNKCLVMRANKHALHIFLELYSICESVNLRMGYFKLKVLELMLFLCMDNDIIVDEKRKLYSKEQIQIVKHIKSHLEEEHSKHITLDELAKEHSIAKTTLKACFKDIYGISPYAYIREYRMNIAAKMLKDTNMNITEIGTMLGYQNLSKFSKAFRDVYKYSPKDYQHEMTLWS